MKKHGRMLATLVVLVLMVGVVFAGCDKPANTASGAPAESAAASAAGTETAAAGTTKTDFRTLYSGEVSTMNYLVTSNTNDMSVAVNVVDCLVEYDQYGAILPALAESWSVSDDGLTWTFKIRQGVKWVDSTGKEVADVTAEDWVSSAKYVLDAANESSTEYMFEGIVKNAAQYYAKTAAALAVKNGDYATEDEYYTGEGVTPPTVKDFSEVGVKAVDKDTLQFTLEAPKPYFLTVLSYGGYYPVYGPFLTEKGAAFGTDKDNLLYNGAYILSDFQPQVQRVLTKNPTYWDKDKVYIEKIEQTYNAEAASLAPEMFKRGEIDRASISSDILDDWQNAADTKDIILGNRPDISYSYFYTFNFDPKFDAQYEPDNWKKAVNNESFRQSLKAALDRVLAESVDEPTNPQALINNTITPASFATTPDGKDYVTYGDLAAINSGDSFNEDKAKQFRDTAKTELAAAGVTFPVKVLMPYNPSMPNWAQSCQVIEQQMEALLGTDYIDIVVEAGPATGFLSEVRRSGKYAFLECNWGADYADPETWAQPFADDNSYNFMYSSEDATTKATVSEYYGLVDAAEAITNDEAARYEAFAKAEAFLINHAIVVPYHVDSTGYSVSLLNPFESQWAPYGTASERYKGMKILAAPMTTADYKATAEQWDADRAAAIAKANGK